MLFHLPHVYGTVLPVFPYGTCGDLGVRLNLDVEIECVTTQKISLVLALLHGR